jgi:solute carrier family 25 aspartate/glutamate transporter 12/13
MLAGGLAGLTQVVATAPMENVKLNLQLGKAGTSTMSMVRQLGLRGLYRGTPATLLRDIPFSFIFFPTSSYLRLVYAEQDRKKGYDLVSHYDFIYII